MQHAEYRVSEGIVSREVGGEVILPHLDTGQYHGLAGSGVRIWELLEEGRSTTEIKNTLLEEFEVEPVEVENDLAQLVRDLVDRKILSRIDS